MGWPELFNRLKRDWPQAGIASDEGGLTSVRSLGDPKEELRIIRENAALLPNPEWVMIVVEGADAVDYLHRRLSQAMNILQDEGTHALQLDGDGRMQAEFLAYRQGNVVFALTGRDSAESAYTITEKFTLMDQVNVHRQWEAEGIIGLVGPKADAALERLGCPVQNLKGKWGMLSPARIGSHECRIFRDGRWPNSYYHISTALDQLEGLAGAVEEACRSIGGGLAGEDAADFQRIALGLPKFGVDTSGSTIPLEAGLENAISFEKGCFPGQEVIARIRNLGHPARQLVKLEMDGERSIPKGAAFQIEGADAGFITSARTLPGLNQTLALGYVKWKMRESAAATVQTPDGAIPARMMA